MEPLGPEERSDAAVVGAETTQDEAQASSAGRRLSKSCVILLLCCALLIFGIAGLYRWWSLSRSEQFRIQIRQAELTGKWTEGPQSPSATTAMSSTSENLRPGI